MTTIREFASTFEGDQSALADLLGISRSYLSLLMSDKKTPSLELAARIERVTGGAVPMSSWVSIELAAQPETAA